MRRTCRHVLWNIVAIFYRPIDRAEWAPQS